MTLNNYMFQILFSIYMATQSITFCVPHGESFANARAAAASIFALIDRKPKIDAFSKQGAKPRRLLGEITLDRVHFSYPSRATEVGYILDQDDSTLYNVTYLLNDFSHINIKDTIIYLIYA